MPITTDPWATDTSANTPLKILTRALHKHAGWFLTEGIILILLGFAAIMGPLLAGIVITVVLGWLLVMAGVVGLVASLRTKAAPGFVWSLLSALWAVMVGAYLLWRPAQGLATLTYVMTAFFLIDGIFMIVLGIAHRRELSGRWEWMLFNGVLDIILAGLIILGLPGSLAWALGLLVGVDLIFGGLSLIMMALHARGS